MNRSAAIALAVAIVALSLGLFAFLAAPGDGPPPASEDPPLSSLPPVQDSAPTAPPRPASTTLPLPAPLPRPAEGATVCAFYSGTEPLGVVQSDALVEVSGLARTGTADALVWAHNDSRNSAIVYAVGADGADLGGTAVRGAFNFDWEDMAVGPGPEAGAAYLYVGDIGDNLGIRGGRIVVYRFAEPEPGTDTVSATALELRYPGGESPNAEALFVDPVDLGLYVVTREPERARVFRASAVGGAETQVLELVATALLPGVVTGADITHDGSIIAFRGEHAVWMWSRDEGATIAESLAGEPCDAPATEERQGESIAFLTNGSYVTISEGRRPPIHRVGYSS